MKSIFERAIALALALVLAATLFGCSIGYVEEPPAYDGIDISGDDVAYSEATEEYATDVIAALIAYYAEEARVSAFFNSAKQSEATEKIQQITAANLLAEEKYLSFIALLEECGSDVIDEVLTGEGGIEKTRALYLELVGKLGVDYIGKTLYEILIWTYEYKYEKNMSEYEKHGYQIHLDDANRALADKATLIDDIGEDKFVEVLKSVMIIPDLLFGGALESEAMSGFSDEEILIFLSHVDFSSLNMSNDGWSLILTTLAPTSDNSDLPYVYKLLYTMESEGDTANVAQVMNELVELIIFTVDGIDEVGVHLLRGGRRDEFLSLTFEKFSEAEWEKLDRIAGVQLSTSKYELQARRVYGTDFTNYKSAIQIKTLAELRTAVGTADFYTTLEGYIAGITPAFSYGMNK